MLNSKANSGQKNNSIRLNSCNHWGTSCTTCSSKVDNSNAMMMFEWLMLLNKNSVSKDSCTIVDNFQRKYRTFCKSRVEFSTPGAARRGRHLGQCLHLSLSGGGIGNWEIPQHDLDYIQRDIVPAAGYIMLQNIFHNMFLNIFCSLIYSIVRYWLYSGGWTTCFQIYSGAWYFL